MQYRFTGTEIISAFSPSVDGWTPLSFAVPGGIRLKGDANLNLLGEKITAAPRQCYRPSSPDRYTSHLYEWGSINYQNDEDAELGASDILVAAFRDGFLDHVTQDVRSFIAAHPEATPYRTNYDTIVEMPSGTGIYFRAHNSRCSWPVAFWRSR